MQVVAENEGVGDSDADDYNDDKFMINGGEFEMVGVGVGDSTIESNQLW